MPPPHPPEFRRRAVELARERAKPIAQIAVDIGISESSLRNWLATADIDDGRREGMTSSEHEELVRLRRENRVLRMEKEILGKPRPSLPPRTAIGQAELRAHRGGEGDYPVTVMCRVLGVGTSSFYDWKARQGRPSPRSFGDADLTDRIRAIHTMSRRSYGSPRVWAELRIGEGVRCSRKRVERPMRLAGIAGLHRRKFRGCTRRDPAATPAEDLVNRQFTVDGTRPALGQRHHRARHRRGQGVRRRSPRWLEPSGRRLVDRRPHPRRAGSRRFAVGAYGDGNRDHKRDLRP